MSFGKGKHPPPEEIVSKVLAKIERGWPVATALLKVGVSRKTWQEWKRLGRGGKNPQYTALLQRIDAAEAHAEGELFDLMRDMGMGKLKGSDWRCFESILRRRWPQRWAESRKIEIETTETTKECLEAIREGLFGAGANVKSAGSFEPPEEGG